MTMKNLRCVVAIAAILLVLDSFPQASGQRQSAQSCERQCSTSYDNFLGYYCGWNTNCRYIGYLNQFYDSCAANCAYYETTTLPPTQAPYVPPNQGNRCGVSQAGRIVGGTQASECEFPWMVMLKFSNGGLCGGSIIGPNKVLTAGHCIYGSPDGAPAGPNDIVVQYGSSSQSYMYTAYVTHVAVHPGFVLKYFSYDAVVLTLDRYLDFSNPCIQPICLPEVGDDPFDTAGCQAAGWGQLRYEVSQWERKDQENLQKVVLPLVPLNQCLQSYGPSMVSEIKICAGDIRNGGIDTCLGDSGGPLMCYRNGVYFAYGIVSFGRGCASPGFPGVYTRVPHRDIISWIRGQM